MSRITYRKIKFEDGGSKIEDSEAI